MDKKLTKQGERINEIVGNYKSLLELKTVYKNKDNFIDYYGKNLLPKEESDFSKYQTLKKLDNSFKFNRIKKEICSLFSRLDNEYIDNLIKVSARDIDFFKKCYGRDVERRILSPSGSIIFSFSKHYLYRSNGLKQNDLSGPLISSDDINSMIKNDVVGLSDFHKSQDAGITDAYGDPTCSKESIPEKTFEKESLVNKINEIKNLSAGKIFLQDLFRI